MKLRLALWIVTAWATTSTFVLFTRPDLSIALNNWMHQRETMESRLFLVSGDGPEGFTAFGNEMSILCARPCFVQEMESAEEARVVCMSVWDVAMRRHMCSARLWPTRYHLVQASHMGRAMGRVF